MRRFLAGGAVVWLVLAVHAPPARADDVKPSPPRCLANGLVMPGSTGPALHDDWDKIDDAHLEADRQWRWCNPEWSGGSYSICVDATQPDNVQVRMPKYKPNVVTPNQSILVKVAHCQDTRVAVEVGGESNRDLLQNVLNGFTATNKAAPAAAATGSDGAAKLASAVQKEAAAVTSLSAINAKIEAVNVAAMDDAASAAKALTAANVAVADANELLLKANAFEATASNDAADAKVADELLKAGAKLELVAPANADGTAAPLHPQLKPIADLARGLVEATKPMAPDADGNVPTALAGEARKQMLADLRARSRDLFKKTDNASKALFQETITKLSAAAARSAELKNEQASKAEELKAATAEVEERRKELARGVRLLETSFLPRKPGTADLKVTITDVGDSTLVWQPKPIELAAHDVYVAAIRVGVAGTGSLVFNRVSDNTLRFPPQIAPFKPTYLLDTDLVVGVAPFVLENILYGGRWYTSCSQRGVGGWWPWAKCMGGTLALHVSPYMGLGVLSAGNGQVDVFKSMHLGLEAELAPNASVALTFSARRVGQLVDAPKEFLQLDSSPVRVFDKTGFGAAVVLNFSPDFFKLASRGTSLW